MRLLSGHEVLRCSSRQEILSAFQGDLFGILARNHLDVGWNENYGASCHSLPQTGITKQGRLHKITTQTTTNAVRSSRFLEILKGRPNYPAVFNNDTILHQVCDISAKNRKMKTPCRP